jgi:hypothetical protein
MNKRLGILNFAWVQVNKYVGASQRGTQWEDWPPMRGTPLQDVIMQSQLKRSPASFPRQSGDDAERNTRVHILDTADAARAEERPVSYATIDSSQ